MSEIVSKSYTQDGEESWDRVFGTRCSWDIIEPKEKIVDDHVELVRNEKTN